MKDSKVVKVGIPSDYSALKLSLKFKNLKRKISISNKFIDWNLFLNGEPRSNSNKGLSSNFKEITFEQEYKAIINTAK